MEKEFYTNTRESIIKGEEYKNYCKKVRDNFSEDTLDNYIVGYTTLDTFLSQVLEVVSKGIAPQGDHAIFYRVGWFVFKYMKIPYPDYITDTEKKFWDTYFSGETQLEDEDVYTILGGNTVDVELTQKLLNDKELQKDIDYLFKIGSRPIELKDTALCIAPKLVEKSQKPNGFQTKHKARVFYTDSYNIIKFDTDRIVFEDLSSLLETAKQNTVTLISSEYKSTFGIDYLTMYGTEEDFEKLDKLLGKSVILDCVSLNRIKIEEDVLCAITFLEALGDNGFTGLESFTESLEAVKNKHSVKANSSYSLFWSLHNSTYINEKRLRVHHLGSSRYDKQGKWAYEMGYKINKIENPLLKPIKIYGLQNFKQDDIIGIMIDTEDNLHLLTNYYSYLVESINTPDINLTASACLLGGKFECIKTDTEEYILSNGQYTSKYKAVYLAFETDRFYDYSASNYAYTKISQSQEHLDFILKWLDKPIRALKELLKYAEENMITLGILQFINTCDNYISYSYTEEATPLTDKEKEKLKNIAKLGKCGTDVEKIASKF